MVGKDNDMCTVECYQVDNLSEIKSGLGTRVTLK